MNNDLPKTSSSSHSFSSGSTPFGPKILNSPSMENLCIDSLDAPPSPVIRIHKDIVSMMDNSINDHDDQKLLHGPAVQIRSKREPSHPLSSSLSTPALTLTLTPSVISSFSYSNNNAFSSAIGNGNGNGNNNSGSGGGNSGSAGTNNGRSLWIGNLDPSVGEQELRQVFEKYGKIESIRILRSGEHCAFVNFERIESAETAKQQLQGTAIGKTIVKIGNAKPSSMSTTSPMESTISPSQQQQQFVGNFGGGPFSSANITGGGNRNNNGVGGNGSTTSGIVNNNGVSMSAGSIATNVGNVNIGNAIGENQNHLGTPGNPSVSASSSSVIATIISSTLNNKSIWIGNITNDITKEMIIKAFSNYGPVESCRILENKMCAFVNFYDSQNASTARISMNGVKLGKTILRTGFAKGQGITNSLLIAGKDGNLTGINGINSINGIVNDSVLESMAKEREIPVINPLPSSFETSHMNTFALKELKRVLEHPNLTLSELVSIFTTQILPILIETCIDPLGNIVVQRAMERGDANLRTIIIHNLGPYLPALAIHKHGTWVIQKLLRFTAEETDAIGIEQRKYLIQMTSSFVVPLMHDAYGNYVVQCCLQFQDDAENDSDSNNSHDYDGKSMTTTTEEEESKEERIKKKEMNREEEEGEGDASEERKEREGISIIWEQIIKHCLPIATNRFGSRAIKSCLDHVINSDAPSSNIISMINKFAIEVIRNLRTLTFDNNGIIIVNWLLEYRKLKGKYVLIAKELIKTGNLHPFLLNKSANIVVFKLVQQTEEPQVHELLIKEIMSMINVILIDNQSCQMLIKILQSLQIGIVDWYGRIHVFLESNLKKYPVHEYPWLKRLVEEIQKKQNLYPEITNFSLSPLVKSNEGGNGISSSSSSIQNNVNNSNNGNSNSNGIIINSNSNNASSGTNQRLHFGSLPKEEYTNDHSSNMRFVSFSAVADSSGSTIMVNSSPLSSSKDIKSTINKKKSEDGKMIIDGSKEEGSKKGEKSDEKERRTSLLDPISRIDIFGSNFRLDRFSSLQ